ncbi:beta-propeller domain-containing protein [Nonomuraea rhizosphaerae]|uniref:beta-propeller domain-containing protein n=1 Tax=Nonomuraea rhizosphaerae TaxID=2665663 RepID=UPI001C60745D|nr:beta-propeller domain-containing protein [Nonomuraea rhizosphaerae]
MKTLIRTVVTGAALATAMTACTSAQLDGPEPIKQRPVTVRLVAYNGCDDMLAGLREHAVREVGPWGFGGPMPMYMTRDKSMAVPDSAAEKAPEHSTTNVHEAGVDEPDLVKTDGNRVITVVDGTLRVIDTATRKVVKSIKLTETGEPMYMPADLLLSGDRALVLFNRGDIMYKSFAPRGETRYVLVDLAGEPKVLGTVKPQGSYVDARMVGSTVRIVTRSQPDLTFPVPNDSASEAERKKANEAFVRKAPLDAWLPKVEITDEAGTVTKKTVDCARVSHPEQYTGTSLLTVHSLDLAQGITAAGTDPISLAADGDTVYGTGQSLYVASNPHWWVAQPMIMEDTAEVPTPLASTAQAPATEPAPDEPAPLATVTPSATQTITPAAAPSPTASPAASASTTPSTTPSTAPSTAASTAPAPTPTAPPEETEVHRFDIGKPGPPAYVSSGKVPGRLLNQYSLSEHDGNLRVATTLTSQDGRSSSSAVYVLKADTLQKVGEVGGLGEGERIYSVRFIGPVGYCVTFKQVDPLYTLDLRDPAAPKVTGELKITGYSAYLHPGNDGRLIGIGQEASDKGRTMGTQISLFDVSDPASPRRLSQMFQKDSGSEAEWDPHAFLYWPKTGLSVIPLNTYTRDRSEIGAMVLKIDDSSVTKVGMIKHPVKQQKDMSYQPSIQRAMVIGDSIWTVSTDGVQVNDATSLEEQAFIQLR